MKALSLIMSTTPKEIIRTNNYQTNQNGDKKTYGRVYFFGCLFIYYLNNYRNNEPNKHQ